MSAQQINLPQKNELVVASISKIMGHGVYAKLLEYPGVEGYCHISEIAPTWIRNIRNHVRLDQQVVAKVMRVNKNTGQVDISIKRVSSSQRKEKIREYKLMMSAKAIIRLIAEKLGRNYEEIDQIVRPPLEENYYSLYAGFEVVATDGIEALEGIDIPEDIKKVIVEVATTSIKISIAEQEIVIGLRSFAPDGLFRVKEALLDTEQVLKEFKDVEYELTTIGAPKYRLYLASKYYEEVEDAKHAALKTIEQKAEELGLDLKVTEKPTDKK